MGGQGGGPRRGARYPNAQRRASAQYVSPAFRRSVLGNLCSEAARSQRCRTALRVPCACVNATLHHPLVTSSVLSAYTWDHRAYGAVRRVHSLLPYNVTGRKKGCCVLVFSLIELYLCPKMVCANTIFNTNTQQYQEPTCKCACTCTCACACDHIFISIRLRSRLRAHTHRCCACGMTEHTH